LPLIAEFNEFNSTFDSSLCSYYFGISGCGSITTALLGCVLLLSGCVRMDENCVLKLLKER